MRFLFQELTNPTKEDLVFFYDGARYVLPAGKTELYPDFLARHGAKALANKQWKAPLDLVGYQKLQDSFLGALKDERTSEKKPTLTEEIALEKERLESVQVKSEPVSEPEFEDLKLK